MRVQVPKQTGKAQKGEDQDQHNIGSGRPQSIPQSINTNGLENHKEKPRFTAWDGSRDKPYFPWADLGCFLFRIWFRGDIWLRE
jgi:hypothetical protein